MQAHHLLVERGVYGRDGHFELTRRCGRTEPRTHHQHGRLRWIPMFSPDGKKLVWVSGRSGKVPPRRTSSSRTGCRRTQGPLPQSPRPKTAKRARVARLASCRFPWRNSRAQKFFPSSWCGRLVAPMPAADRDSATQPHNHSDHPAPPQQVNHRRNFRVVLENSRLVKIVSSHAPRSPSSPVVNSGKMPRASAI